MGGGLSKGQSHKEKRIALTFDDGYKYTLQILFKLRQYNVKATFFLCGDWMETSPTDCYEIFKAGHEIGNHSYDHSDMLKLSDAEILEEVKKTQKILQRIIGKEGELFRFPYGNSSKHLIQLMEGNGMLPIKWSVDSQDWRDISAEEIFDNVVNNKALDSGAIILFHTHHQHTVDALDSVIPALKEMGYRMVTVSELIKETGMYRRKMKRLERSKRQRKEMDEGKITDDFNHNSRL